MRRRYNYDIYMEEQEEVSGVYKYHEGQRHMEVSYL
jgi:hypothetical protein